MFELIFLGTSGSVPSVERGLPSIAIKHDGNVFLFDCGEGTQRQMMKYHVGYGSLKAIFISHLHLDHFIGVYGLIETLYLTSPSPKELQIFAPKGFQLINERPFVKLSEITSGELLKEPSIRAFPVRHGKGAYGFVIKENDRIKFNAEKAHGLGMKGKMFREIQEKGFVVVNSRKITLEEVSFLKPGVKIVYSGDCAPSKKLLEYAKDADLLIHEATFGSEHAEEAVERLHSTVVDAAHIAKDANVKQLIVTHISPRYEKEEKRKRLLEEARAIFNNTILAYDGLRLVIK